MLHLVVLLFAIPCELFMDLTYTEPTLRFGKIEALLII